ncbi:MAG: hypothetical protein KA105_02570 [Caulobacter sp.]|nr:hypothetical protein [Caulobacter sp.]
MASLLAIAQALRPGESAAAHVSRTDRLARRLAGQGFTLTRKPGTLIAVIERVAVAKEVAPCQ